MSIVEGLVEQRNAREDRALGACIVTSADHGLRERVDALAGERGFKLIWASSLAHAHALLDACEVPSLRYALIDDELPDGCGLKLALRLGTMRSPPGIALFGDSSCSSRVLAAFRLGHALLPRPTGMGQVISVLEALDLRRANRMSESGAVQDKIRLEQHGLHIADDFIPISQAGMATLRFLLERGARFTSSADIALRMLGRRDRASHSLVRRYVADTRRALGPYGWLIETAPKIGYRLAPRAFVQD